MAGGKPDVSNVGPDKAVQTPEQAEERDGGTYRDPVESLSESDRYPYGSRPADPNPIRK